MSVKKVIENNIVKYDCLECHMKFERRYNATRHYDRFHETLKMPKQCIDCKKCFKTKGEYYKHREKVHNDIKRYCKQQILNEDTENQTKSLTCVENDSEQSEVEQTCNNLDFTISNMKKKYSHLTPKKRFLYKWQKALQIRRSPLRPIENIKNSVPTNTTNDLNITGPTNIEYDYPTLIIFDINNSERHTYVVKSVPALTNILGFINF